MPSNPTPTAPAATRERDAADKHMRAILTPIVNDAIRRARAGFLDTASPAAPPFVDAILRVFREHSPAPEGATSNVLTAARRVWDAFKDFERYPRTVDADRTGALAALGDALNATAASRVAPDGDAGELTEQHIVAEWMKDREPGSRFWSEEPPFFRARLIGFARRIFALARSSGDARGAYWSACAFCGESKSYNSEAEMDADTEAERAHAATCPKHPAVIALAKAKAEGGREALTKLVRVMRSSGSGVPLFPSPENVEAFRDREYPLPAAPERECVLSDGRVVEWMTWDMRNGVECVSRTLDIVTNKGQKGCESRRCYASLDEMRRDARLSWADWQLIEKAFALALATAKEGDK